jgi:hypothetical protein
MRTRGQWLELTRRLLGEQAGPFLMIQRGGYAWGGKAVLFDIGTQDTFAIAAHEGWHQYTQRAFKQPLPAWLEEGLATYMEGHKWLPGGEPEFRPWANPERFDELRRAAAAGRLMSLEQLLEVAPTGFLSAARAGRGGGETSPDAAVYYAQVWALTLFLFEHSRPRGGDAGAVDAGPGQLSRLLADAVSGDGRMDRAVSALLGPESQGQGRASSLALRRGPAVFLTYCSRDMERSSREYAEFVEQVVRTGSRGAIVDGKSPIQPAPGGR